MRSEAGCTAATAFIGGLNPTYIFKQTGLGTPVRLFKRHSNRIDGADRGREARKLKSLFGEFGHILATEKEFPLKYNNLFVTHTGATERH